MKEILDKKAVETGDSMEGENKESELTAEQQEKMEKIGAGLQQAENEFEKIDISDTKIEGNQKQDSGFKKQAAKVMLFFTLITSVGAFADKAEANDLGRAAGEAIERIFDPQGLTLRQRRQLDNAMFNNYIRGIKTQQKEGNNWRKDASDAQRRNLKQRLEEIENDKSLTYEQKMDAIERARRGQN